MLPARDPKPATKKDPVAHALFGGRGGVIRGNLSWSPDIGFSINGVVTKILGTSTLLGAPGLTTRSDRMLLGAPGIATNGAIGRY